jgi:hypothetical protein
VSIDPSLVDARDSRVVHRDDAVRDVVPVSSSPFASRDARRASVETAPRVGHRHRHRLDLDDVDDARGRARTR